MRRPAARIRPTVCRDIGNLYLNWDNTDDRRLLLRGPAALAAALHLDRLRAKPPVTVLDELHKYSKWKSLLKGFFDTHGDRVRLLVTGGADGMHLPRERVGSATVAAHGQRQPRPVPA